ncbi:hypothetical protein [uncultured Serinicoccus sp.]|uniref:hypothetical protein n=1 Tax=uncultured Serinicoccus sp. TaxID=735514 RepID=UPI002615A332|nr:hypothetical protein [uncultured Serinicoccus sp.]
MPASSRHNYATLLVLLLLVIPFTMITDPLSDMGHKAWIVALSIFVAAVWRVGVVRWGLGASLLAAGAAVPVLVVVQAALLLDVWPVPEGSTGVFALAFPMWIVVVTLTVGGALHLLQKHRHLQAQTS